MRDNQREARFEQALKDWHVAAQDAAQSREAYRSKWARLYVESMAKTADARKCEADAQTSDERLHRDVQQIDTALAYHRMVFLRGPEVMVTRPEEE